MMNACPYVRAVSFFPVACFRWCSVAFSSRSRSLKTFLALFVGVSCLFRRGLQWSGLLKNPSHSFRSETATYSHIQQEGLPLTTFLPWTQTVFLTLFRFVP